MTNSTKTTRRNNSELSDRPSAVLICKGVLDWHRHERVTDRYGTVVLFSSPDSSRALALNTLYEGQCGQLVAKVIEIRQSSHIGDIARSLYPTTPPKGQLIRLGYGQLFFEDDGPSQSVGVRPLDGRESDWLDPASLYQCHSQTVELLFFPDVFLASD